MKKGITAILLMIVLSYSAFALVGHNPSEIFPGTFSGHFKFENVTIMNQGNSSVLTIENNITSPEVCISGDCRTAWPTSGGDSLWVNSSGNATFTTGNVGIGTDSPMTVLDVEGTIRSTTQTIPTNGSGIELLYSQSKGYVGSIDRRYNLWKNIQVSGNNITFWSGTNLTDDGERMRISSSGNVGIGTTSPNSKLTVAGNITPSLNNTYSLGSPELMWRDVYVGNDSLYIGGKKLSNEGGTLLWGGEEVGSGAGGNVAPGTIMAFNGTSCPSGWVIADGTQGTPDLRGRVIAGFNSGDASFDGFWETGGAKTHTLTTAEMPSHSHSVTYGGKAQSGSGAANVDIPGAPGTAQIGTSSTGSGNAHNIMQPYMALIYCVNVNGSESSGGSGSSLWTNSSGNATFVSGNVGIGTDSPEAKLHIGGTTLGPDLLMESESPYLRIVDTTNNNKADIVVDNSGSIYFSPNASNNAVVFRANTGNVGIGTSSPSSSLHVKDSSYGSNFTLQSSRPTGTSGENNRILFNNQNFPMAAISVYQDYYNNEGDLLFYTSDKDTTPWLKEKMVIKSNGNVGIGTTSPGGLLHLKDDSANAILLDRTDNSGVNTLYRIGVNSEDYLNVGKQGELALVIDNNSNIGIGTDSPSALLEVNKNQASETALKVYNPTSSVGASAKISVGVGDGYGLDIFRNGPSADIFLDATQGNGKIRFQDGGVDTLTIDSSGNVGIGTTNPSYALDVVGDIFSSSNIIAGGYLQDPGMVAYGANSMCFDGLGRIGGCTSTLALKENVTNLSIGLETLEKLRPVNFNWKEDGKADLGFIAEEVEEVDSLLASYDMEGNLSGVKYRHISALLTKSIQELKQENDILKEELCLKDSSYSWC